MKAITLLLNSYLPEDLRDDSRVFDKKGIEKLMADVATLHPNKYADIVKKISDVGRETAYLQGETLGLEDFKPVIDKDAALAELDEQIEMAERVSKTPKEAEQRKLKIWSDFATKLEKSTISAALAKGNNLGNTVISGARGNAFQLKAMVTTPALYTDYKDQPIPLFVRRSFGEGLRPYEYLASTFGVRKGVISTKNSTAEAGDVSKQMAVNAARLVVTDDDCGTSNGIDLDLDDNDVVGRVLPRDIKGIPAGTVLGKQAISKLRNSGVSKIMARSPLTCQAKNGICAKCLGTLPGGKFAPKGYSAGMTAANALGEPLAQGSLNTKHSGGGFTGEKKTFSGFDVIDQLVQSPETFPYKATVATMAGRVDAIEDAPQGGKFVTIAGTKHYMLPDFEPLVKVGETVEAGDQLSEGIVDPEDIVQHRGLGEARQYYVDRLRQAYDESGAGRPSRTNLEVIARAALDHVRIDDPEGLGDYLPDDIASYNRIAANYQPPKDVKFTPASAANGKYLHSPALHFTIGTKLTPKMTKRIQAAGLPSVAASDTPPKFVPEMKRLRAGAHSGEDWMARLHSSYLSTNLAESASRARDTDTEANTHFAPRLAIGKGFGDKIEQTGKF